MCTRLSIFWLLCLLISCLGCFGNKAHIKKSTGTHPPKPTSHPPVVFDDAVVAAVGDAKFKTFLQGLKAGNASLKAKINDFLDTETAGNDYYRPMVAAVLARSLSSIQKIQVIQYLYDQGADLALGDRSNRTPLGWAVEIADEAIVKTLLDLGAGVNQETDWAAEKTTPLAWAEKLQNKESDTTKKAEYASIIKLLKSKGAR